MLYETGNVAKQFIGYPETADALLPHILTYLFFLDASWIGGLFMGGRNG